jgi:hypothetical protein
MFRLVFALAYTQARQVVGNHLWKLRGKSWRLLMDSLSTSTLSIIIFSVAVPVVIFLIPVVVEWWGAERSFKNFATALTKKLRIGVVLAVGFETLVWLFLLAWASFTAIYNDHHNLSGRLRAVVNEKNELKEGLGVRDEYIKRLEEKNARPRIELQSRPAAPTVINAPGGIPIVGNKGTVDHPTVNNYGPVPRRLSPQTKTELATCFSKKTGTFSVIATPWSSTVLQTSFGSPKTICFGK